MPPFPLRQTTPVQVFAASTALTGSYVAGTIVSTDEANALCVMVTYTKGDETSMQLKVESTNDSGALSSSSNWYQQLTQSASGGTVTVTPAEYSITASGLPATQKFTFIINPVKGTGFRISAKQTGSASAPGTFSIQAYTGWV